MVSDWTGTSIDFEELESEECEIFIGEINIRSGYQIQTTSDGTILVPNT